MPRSRGVPQLTAFHPTFLPCVTPRPPTAVLPFTTAELTDGTSPGQGGAHPSVQIWDKHRLGGAELPPSPARPAAQAFPEWTPE